MSPNKMVQRFFFEKRLDIIAGVIISFLCGAFLIIQQYQAITHPKILIEWKTESELDVIGYNIFKSEKPDDDYEQVNTNLIPVAPDPFAENDYSYLDLDVIAGHTYYYKLQSLSADGTQTLHGPIISKAKDFTILSVGLSIIPFIIGGVLLIIDRPLRRKEDNG